MTSDTETIEIDAATARSLQEQAAARGITVAEIIAELLPLATDADAIAELDRRWDAARKADGTVPHEDVVRWLETWGTPAFKPWQDR